MVYNGSSFDSKVSNPYFRLVIYLIIKVVVIIKETKV